MTKKYQLKRMIWDLEKYVDILDDDELSNIMSVCLKEVRRRKKDNKEIIEEIKDAI